MTPTEFDVRRIHTFLAERVDLKGFCFVLENEFGSSRYRYDFLEGSVPLAKSRSLIEEAKANDELGEIVYQLAIYWLDNLKRGENVLAKASLHEDLRVYYVELLSTQPEKAELVRMLHNRFAPTPLPALASVDVVDVVVSYSRRNLDKMRAVRAALSGAGLAVWVDEEGIAPGSPSWKRAIESAIDRAGCLVVLLSPDAKGSLWVQREIDYAQAQQKPIFPILVEGDEKQSVPLSLAGVHWIDLRSSRDYAATLNQLVNEIKKNLRQT